MNYWLEGHTQREVICDSLVKIKIKHWRLRLGKRPGLHFTWGNVAGALLGDSIRNMLIRILVDDK